MNTLRLVVFEVLMPAVVVWAVGSMVAFVLAAKRLERLYNNPSGLCGSCAHERRGLVYPETSAPGLAAALSLTEVAFRRALVWPVYPWWRRRVLNLAKCSGGGCKAQRRPAGEGVR
ncbi:hypothetical protein ACFFR3_45695 [Nonomuraea salmonea]|uniref:FeoB-associated Cys-rich membrane protein n=1 Tax=Nonomuraea salmonea TaxID=46181 RepID=A0ABV5P4H4_9ACTN